MGYSKEVHSLLQLSGFTALHSLRLGRTYDIASLKPLGSIQGNLESPQLGRLSPTISLQPLGFLTTLTALRWSPLLGRWGGCRRLPYFVS